MCAKRRFLACSRCHISNPPEGYYANGYCKPCGRAYYAKWRKDHPKRNTKTTARYYRQNRAKILARTRAYGQRLKLAAFSAYGSQCACCGEIEHEFLAIDHINGGRHGTISGHKHRESVAVNGGVSWYRWLRNQGFPPGYRVLCHNCNQAYGHFGYCPHITRQKTLLST